MHPDLLYNSRTGIVRRLAVHPVPAHFPASFRLVDTYLADTTTFGPWPVDTAGAGYTFTDPAHAVAAALGEAAERYCGNLVPPGLPTTSFTALAAAGTAAVDPAQLALFASHQYATPGFPFVPLTRDLPMPWATGTDLATGRPVAVPAALVWVNHPGGPRTNPIVQAGLAAGPSRAAADDSALREVVERDAMTVTWAGGRPLYRIRPTATLRRLGAGPAGALHTDWYAFPAEVGLPVTGALVADSTTGYLTLGMGCHSDPVTAMTKALGEALQLHLLLADYDDPDGPFARAATSPDSPLKPWRPGRDYAAAYRRDLADAVDYGCHLQLHLDPAVQQRFHAQLHARTAGETTPDDLAADAPADLPATVRRLADLGRQVVSVDVTTPDVRAAGLHVTRVVVPGYYTNSAAGLPLLGGTRLPPLPRDADRPLPLPH
ncbi:YcaO-like family protein [Dactylosporangium sp. NPDC005572]|uniref:YcaO-like family protein n=1 Tax=Dactylosporangium sp. NPDC005572 TaxID=3156889 RepID=UPI0033ABA93A